MYATQSIFTSDAFTVLIALYIITTIINQVSMVWHRKRLKELKDDIRRESAKLENEKRRHDRYL